MGDSGQALVHNIDIIPTCFTCVASPAADVSSCAPAQPPAFLCTRTAGHARKNTSKFKFLLTPSTPMNQGSLALRASPSWRSCRIGHLTLRQGGCTWAVNLAMAIEKRLKLYRSMSLLSIPHPGMTGENLQTCFPHRQS